MNILVSGCLLGLSCRYDRKELTDERIIELGKKHTLIPVCPEIMGGLPTPRMPAEIIGGRVITNNGTDVTDSYNTGAQEVLKTARLLSCRYAILKAHSPSCGCGKIYDGTFSHTLTDGDGVTAALLKENGIMVLNENSLDALED